MEVILLERIERLGMIGDVVNVKPGYARNFLLPKGKALRSTKENRTAFEAQRAQIEANNLKHKQDAQKVADKITGTVLVMIRQAGDSGQLYGSVTAKDVSDTLAEQKVTLDRHQVKIDTPIKMLGIHRVRLALHPEVIVEIKINVAKTSEEAESQLAAETLANQKPAEEVIEAKPTKKNKAEQTSEEQAQEEVTEE